MATANERNVASMNHGQIVSFIWGVADLIRDTFKRGKYQDQAGLTLPKVD